MIARITTCIAVLLIFGVQSVVAQQTGSCESMVLADLNSNNKVMAETYIDKYPRRDNQYFGDWRNGNIFFINGDEIKNKVLRYNSYIDNFIWQRQSDMQMGIVPNIALYEIHLEDLSGEPLVFRRMNVRLPFQINDSEVFLQVLTEGTFSLYCYRKVKHIKNSDEEFYTDYTYYLSNKDKELKIISLNGQSFYSLFTKEEKSLFKSILKKNKLKLRRENELALALKMYNQQLAGQQD